MEAELDEEALDVVMLGTAELGADSDAQIRS